MWRKSLIGFSTVVVGGYHLKSYSTCANIVKGYCELGPNGKPCHGQVENGKDVKGYVRFEDNGTECRIYYRVTGLKPGYHGFHM